MSTELRQFVKVYEKETRRWMDGKDGQEGQASAKPITHQFVM